MSAFLNFAGRHDVTDSTQTKLLTAAAGRCSNPLAALQKAHDNLNKERAKLARSLKRKIFLNDQVMMITQQFHNETVVTLAQEYVVAPGPAEA